ncbi:MAG: ATP-binding protein [Candidatus Electrothrix communis]|nr:MAG: ATP-binding protein [Candidatus Electrothrix communis]
MTTNAANLQLALDWLKTVISSRLRMHLGQSETFEISPLNLSGEPSSLSAFLEHYNPDFEEFTLLLLALAPHLHPNFFSQIIAEHLPEGGDFPEFGGVKAQSHRGILPTGETALFILAGDNLEQRLAVQQLFGPDHWFTQHHILDLEAVRDGEPTMSGRLILDAEMVELLILGTVSRPRFSMDFPAEYIETKMEWDDLVLNPKTLRQIREIETWISHNATLMNDWGMGKKIKPGFRALFYGPPGTGKTLTATLLGKQTDKEVFRIDLSRVVSKYIGETEKNLSRLFDKAEHKNWILFFDEADALFGKRTDIRDAHDKYANQEVAYLLQRIEGYNGLVILATNQRSNIDDAFIRRFQTIIHFPLPNSEERCLLWQKTFPAQIMLADDIDWQQIAARFELTGAGILNVTHYCALEFLSGEYNTLSGKQLEAAILREYVKEGKVV